MQDDRPLLARARRRRVPARRDRPHGQGRRAARRAAGDERRSRCRCTRTQRALERRLLGQPARGRSRRSRTIREAAGRRAARRRGLPADERDAAATWRSSISSSRSSSCSRPGTRERLRAAIEPAAELGRVAWVMSNHDFDRLATRVGPENLRAAAVLLLTLPGVAFVYQGDEIGLANGPGAEPPFDRAGRDGLRHPMQWDASATGGFTTGSRGSAGRPDGAERRVAAGRPRLAARALPAADRASPRPRRGLSAARRRARRGRVRARRATSSQSTRPRSSARLRRASRCSRHTTGADCRRTPRRSSRK